MKIRIYSPFFPFPVTEGAYQVIYDQARTLAELHEVEMLVWKSDEADIQKGLLTRDPIPYSNRICQQSFYHGRSRETPLDRLARVGRALATGRPSPALFYYPTEDLSRWHEIVRKTATPDLGIYHYSFASLWRKSMRRPAEKKTVCYLHNLESDLFSIRARSEKNLLFRMVHSLNARRLWKIERDLPKYFDELWFISEADREDYCRRYSNNSSKFKTVPPTFDPQIFSIAKKLKTTVTRTNLTFGFLGKLDYEPNRQGIMWFIKEVAPLLATRSFQGEIWIGGKNADAELLNAAVKFPFIHFKGFIDRLENWYRDVDISLAPHFSGSGTRIKLLDALSYATPVLCHPATAQRIDVSLRDLPSVLIRQSAGEWAETILDQEKIKQVMANYVEFPQGLDGQKIYSFLEAEPAAYKVGKELAGKIPPLHR